MTHHTDAELLPCPFCGCSDILAKTRKTTMVECKGCGAVVFDCQDGIRRDAIAAWNRRAPAAPVPQGWKDVAELCAQMCDSRAKSLAGDAHIAAASEARKCASVLRNPPDYWREKLQAAAPQPPEAAPVELPEPQAEIEVRSMKTYLDLSIHEWRDTLPDGAYNIYTEQQLRELLANHGIQERST